ncbi:MAG: type II toxin-antitoxin system RelE/ParE family toxin [Planctomycetes bacterium]|nr:type II toxin-antitoxin system RelE/ParE family toxin [Planctomycetota bacterium]
MKEKDLAAYQGSEFTIEWYSDKSGKIPALEFFMELTEKEQNKLFLLFRRMGEFGRISDTTKFNHEGDQIYAFKPQPNRFLCFFQLGKKVIVTSAFCKKQQKIPKREKDRSLQCRKDYLKRVELGEYYEN